jgi:carboxylesterase
VIRTFAVRGTRDAFEFAGDGSGRGALVLHGFTGSPFEVRYLGERLSERGLHVIGPALAGHAHGLPDELDRTTWHDWYATAEAAFDRLRARCSRVAVVGLSMGGLLSLHMARARGAEIAALGLLATPIWLKRQQELAIRAVNRVLDRGLRRPLVAALVEELGGAHIPKLGGESDIADPAGRYENPTMPAMPIRALGSLLDLQKVVRGELAQVHNPVFLAHSRQDHTAPYACAAGILKRIGSRDVRALSLERSYHVITVDVDRAEVARDVGDFVEERLR